MEISKGTSRFAAAAYIASQTDAVLPELGNEVARWRPGDERIPRRIAHYYSELNAIHPFREGNGRTIRLFLSLLALQYGWYLDWSKTTAAREPPGLRRGILRRRGAACRPDGDCGSPGRRGGVVPESRTCLGIPGRIHARSFA